MSYKCDSYRLRYVVLLAVLALPVHAAVNVSEAAAHIDSLVKKKLDNVGLLKNPGIDDYVFIRRVYLDIGGRIPTLDELNQFVENPSPNKRAELIDSLLGSEAYVSHFYNYWEDILRVQSKGRRTVMVSYQDWIKQALRENMPYNEFVAHLISSDGYIWENPASGYYLRDAGMPLDNMSNTAQVFLGTRMQCAQCHDHPFDAWTQLDYYHMAAYTANIAASARYSKIPEVQALQKFIRNERLQDRKRLKKSERKEKSKKVKFSAVERRAMRDIFEPLGARVWVDNSSLKLPADYPYDNAKPGQVIQAKTPFGIAAPTASNVDKRDVYVTWMTSPDNPRFTLVIANRLWKKVMGVGLIEPVDDVRDDTVASDPELMGALQNLMIDCQYDQQCYLRVLFNTQIYQAQAQLAPAPDQAHHYQGPTLRRMSAEQLWDSLLTLAKEDVDSDLNGDSRVKSLRQQEKQMETHVHNVKSLGVAEIRDLIAQHSERQKLLIDSEKVLQSAMRKAQTKDEKQALKRKYAQLKRKQKNALTASLSMMGGEMLESNKKKNKRGKAYMVRASEVVSPTPAGHFLQQFGESRRDLIESSHTEASVPQALTMLNGNSIHWISSSSAVLGRNIRSDNKALKLINTIFLSIYSRPPEWDEYKYISGELANEKGLKTLQMVLLAMINSHEFRFIQ